MLCKLEKIYSTSIERWKLYSDQLKPLTNILDKKMTNFNNEEKILEEKFNNAKDNFLKNKIKQKLDF